jgi:hypothetical protein
LQVNTIFFTYLFIFITFICSGQVINTHPADVPLGPINFNKEYIKQNKIKSISVSLVDKPDGSIILDKGATQGFEFDEKARLIRYYYTVLNRVEKIEREIPAIIRKGRVIQPATSNTYTYYLNDTIFCNLFYDEKNNIVGKRTRTGDYYDAYYYEYNEAGQIKKELHCRETNSSENKKEFKLGVQTVLSSETFEYIQLTPTQTKKRCLNDEGREYKKAIINYNEKGNKISESYEFIVGWMKQENKYTYNEKNQLIENAIVSNESGDINKKSVFIYNDKGNVITEKRFVKDVLLNEISYLYDETNTILKSHINRDFKNASIGIVKYMYSFY